MDVSTAPRPGTARSALANRGFRTVWVGSLGSNVGTWMQNAVIGAYGWDISHSAVFVSLLSLAQLGPQFFLAVPGGALVDRLDRRRVILATQSVQMVFSLLLVSAPNLDGTARRLVLLGCIAATGVALSLFLPATAAFTATLVGPRDLAGAVSLQFVALNLSRVIGPFLGIVLYERVGVGWVFVLNGVSYLAAIVTVYVVRHETSRSTDQEDLWRRIRFGLDAVRADGLLRWALSTIALFSFFSLTFLSLLPAMAERLYGITPKSTGYAALYATFGVGAAVGAVSVGTALVGRPLIGLVRGGLAAYAVGLGLFGSLATPRLAYPLLFVVGSTYFVAVTALSTALQQRLDNRLRGRVMALWFMAFGGTIPLGAATMSVVSRYSSLRLVLWLGAAVSALLALRRPQADREPPVPAP